MGSVIKSNQINILAKLIRVGHGSPVPQNLRIFLVWKNGYTYANKGHLQESHSVGSLFSHLRRDRGDILNAFSKLEFLIMELVRIKTMGDKFSYNENLVNLIAKPNVSNLLQLLQKWKTITKTQQGKCAKLFSLRNQLAHIFDLSEAIYDNQVLIRTVGKDGFNQFAKDLVSLWKELVLVYSKEQTKIDYTDLIGEIQNLQKSKGSKKTKQSP